MKAKKTPSKKAATKVRKPRRLAPVPGSAAPGWSYSHYRAALYLDGKQFAIVTPDGRNSLSKKYVSLLLKALNSKPQQDSVMVANMLAREQRRREAVKRRAQQQRDNLDDQYLYHRLKLSGSIWDPENQAKIKAKRKELKDWRDRMAWMRDAQQRLFMAKQQYDTLKQLIKEHHDHEHRPTQGRTGKGNRTGKGRASIRPSGRGNQQRCRKDDSGKQSAD